MSSDKYQNFETLAIHGAHQDDEHQALSPPLYLTSTFDFTDIQQADDTFSFKRKAYVYTRGGNPTINLFEQRLAMLEGGVDGVAFASGMAAVTTTLLSLVSAGDEIILHRNLYGSTFCATNDLFPKYGIKTHFTDLTSIDNLMQHITPKTKAIFFETPTNPALEIIDIAAVAEVAHQHNIKVVVDNTFCSPYFQQPLKHGADIVVHSATKYISGHGDALGGIAVSKDQDFITKLKFGYLCELGGVLSPFNAWLFLRGLKTLALRMNKHQENVLTIANFLKDCPQIEKINYPGLPSHPQYEIAKKQMAGVGGVISFELKGDMEVAKKFIHALKLARIAVSLGDTETLVQIPALMTHRGYPDHELEKFGFSKKTVRISAGLEDAKDIIADIEQAMEKAKG